MRRKGWRDRELGVRNGERAGEYVKSRMERWSGEWREWKAGEERGG